VKNKIVLLQTHLSAVYTKLDNIPSDLNKQWEYLFDYFSDACNLETYIQL
jgi:hypothetical protein